MAALPPSTDFTGSGVTEGGFKTAITSLRDYLSGLFGTDGVPLSAVVALGAWTTGDVKLTLKTAADTGWVLCNDGTIGNAASGGTTRANADTVALFTLLWNNVADAQAAVSGGRGANAAADYAANKTIALTKMLGRAFGASGAGAGLTSRVLGLATGVETVALSTAELAAHTHTGPSHTHTGGSHTHGGTTGTQSANHTHNQQADTLLGAGGGATGAGGSPAGNQGGTTSGDNSTHTHSFTTDAGGNVATDAAGTGATGSTGSGTAHQNMQPTAFVNAMIKL